VFVAGPNESQQLTAIADRVAPDPNVKRSKSGVLPFALLGAVVALIVLGGGLILMKKRAQQQQQEDPSVPTVGAQSPIDMEQQILKDARALCTKDDCERAHIKATTGLRENSPLRDSQDFKDLEASWAEWNFARADAEPDFGKRKEIYQRVSQTITVDKEHRKIATDKLEALDRGMTADPAPTDSITVATADPPAQASAPATSQPQPPRPTANSVGTRPPNPTTAHPPPPPPPTQPTAAPTPKPPSGGSPVERARALLLDHPDQAKLILYDRLTKGGTPEEFVVLKQACKATSDGPCVAECKRRLGQ
jgi:hypothetical protein